MTATWNGRPTASRTAPNDHGKVVPESTWVGAVSRQVAGGAT